MATPSSIPAWRIPWTEEPGGLQSMESQSWTRLSDFTHFTHSTEMAKCSPASILYLYHRNPELSVRNMDAWNIKDISLLPFHLGIATWLRSDQRCEWNCAETSKKCLREFPGGPEIRTQCSHCHGSVPGQGTKIPQVAQCGQKNKIK